MSDGAALAAFREEIERKCRLHVQVFEDRDPTPVVDECFRENALCECAGLPRRRGKTKLRELFSQVVQTGHAQFRPFHSHVAGLMTGVLWIIACGPRDAVETWLQLRCVFAWLNRSGTWKVHACVDFTVPYFL